MFSVEINDRKESEEERMLIQNKCVSSQNKREKEEGATVVASHLPFPAGSLVIFVRPDRQRFPRKHSTLQESPIKYHKCPTNETKPRWFLDFQTDWLSNSDEQTHKTKKDADESEKAD